MKATTDSERLPPGTVAALAALALMVFVIGNDVTSIAVALPRIQTDFDTDVSTVQWAITAYATAFGVAIITGGRLADAHGRRRVLLLGALGFAVSALAGGLAPHIIVLLVARAAMGLTGAMMWAAILGLVYSIVPAARAGLAGAVVIGTAGVGNATGPLVGGLLDGAFGWRAILLVNVPCVLVAAAIVARTVRADADRTGRHLDPVAVGLLSGTLLSALVVLSVIPDSEWSVPSLLALTIVAVVLGAAFVGRERRRGDDALVPPVIRRTPGFRAACGATLLMASTWFTVLLYLPEYFQQVADESVLGTGVALVPLMITCAGASFAAAPVTRRFGVRVPSVVGAIGTTVGVVLLAAGVSSQPGRSTMTAGMIVLGLGMGLFYAAVVTAGITALPADASSLGGAILYTFQVAGGALGLGLTTLVFELAANSVDLGSETGVASARIRADAPVAFDVPFATGLRWALLFNAALAVAGTAVTIRGVGEPVADPGLDPGSSIVPATP